MSEIHKFTKKEKTVFWAAAIIGITGGVIGNLFASALWQSVFLLLGDNGWAYLIVVILIGLAFFYIVVFIRKQIEKNRPIKKKDE